jgi:MFS transporter, DHA1 family, inner membrane transport protein
LATAASTATGPVGELPRAQERLAIASLALAAFALNLNTNVLGALLPFLPEDLGLGSSGSGYLVAAAALGSAVGSLAVGPLAARFGRRTVLVGGLAVFVVASLLHLLVASLWSFVVLRSLAGAAVGLAYAAASALAAEVSPYSRRGAAMGRFNAGMFLAIPIGMPLSVWMARSGYWSGIFVVQAMIGALGAYWAVRAVPPQARAERPTRQWHVLSRGPVLAGLIATMLHVGSFFTSVQLATTWLDHTGMVPKADQMYLWVGLGGASVIGSAVLGRFSDRIGKRAFVLVTSVLLVGCFGLLARTAEAPDATLLLVVGTVLAVSAAARTGPLQALVSGLVPASHLGALMGVRGAVMQIGVFGFAVSAAPIGAELGFRGVLMLAAACQLLSYLVIRFGVREVR